MIKIKVEISVVVVVEGSFRGGNNKLLRKTRKDY